LFHELRHVFEATKNGVWRTDFVGVEPINGVLLTIMTGDLAEDLLRKLQGLKNS
jgi:hypothetical protein